MVDALASSDRLGDVDAMTVTDIRVPASRRAPVRRWSWFTYMAVIIGPALVGALLGYVGRKTQEPASGGELVAPQAAVVAGSAFPGAEIDYVGKGTWKVPGEAPPGTYALAAPSSTVTCGWQRLKAVDDKPKSVIDEGSVGRGEFGKFTISPADEAIRLIGACTWVRQ